jgi:hypothetical protein
MELIMISSIFLIESSGPIYPGIEQYIPQDLFLKWILFLVYSASFTFALVVPFIAVAVLYWIMRKEAK